MGHGWSKRLDDWMSPPQRYQYSLPPAPPVPPPSRPPSSSSAAPFSPPSSSAPVSTVPPPSYVFPAPCYPPNQTYQTAAPYPRPPSNGYNYYYQYPAGGFQGRPNYQYYPVNQGPLWWPAPPAIPYPASSSSHAVQQQPPAPYVEHQQAIKIKNNINLHKDTISLRRDEQIPDHWLVSFTFDALLDGSVTIYYFAREGERCDVVPMDPGIYSPVPETFQKGLGQKFSQSSGHGIDLEFFELDSLSKPSYNDVFPLVICAKARAETADAAGGESPTSSDLGAQITFSVIEKSGDNTFKVKVIKQILWNNGEKYELKEIFGLANATNDDANSDYVGKECVICMSEPNDTAVMPCRHMCMCRECAKTFRLHSSNCPICRHPVEELMEIRVNKG